MGVPFYLGTAADAASKLLTLGRDLAILNAELRAKRQMQRAAWIASAASFFVLFIIFPSLWLTIELHQRGWSALRLAGISAALFGLLSLRSALIAWLYFRGRGLK